jgi:glycosyltransferase involved in cell wall biosynthesis
MTFRLFAPRALDTEVAQDTGAVPFFRRSLYESVGRPNFRQVLTLPWRRGSCEPPFDRTRSEIATFRTLNRDYRRDLARLPCVWNAENIVLVLGLSQNELQGLVRHLLRLPAAQRPAVICTLMFAPPWTSWGAPAVHGVHNYRRTFELAAPLLGRSLFFVTETAALAAYYQSAFGVRADLLPIPLAFDGASYRPRAGVGTTAFGYFGYSKTAKGFHLLPRTVETCRARGLAASFVIHVQHTRWEAAVVAAEAALDRLSDVSLVKGQLNRDDYYSLFDRVDAMLLPYDPEEYGQRGSGILVEAVSRGLPVIAAAGTWAASVVSSGEAAGEVFAPFVAEALAEAVERLIARFDVSRKNAAAAAAKFGAANSAAAYVSAILDIARRKAGEQVSPDR